jgi:hypothetical protein
MFVPKLLNMKAVGASLAKVSSYFSFNRSQDSDTSTKWVMSEIENVSRYGTTAVNRVGEDAKKDKVKVSGISLSKSSAATGSGGRSTYQPKSTYTPPSASSQAFNPNSSGRSIGK